ncbi:MAG: VWA domain-containing protein [Acidobacteria bacterium]|nr:VWA domain-containing protein [Acidobacteriota bacterium]
MRVRVLACALALVSASVSGQIPQSAQPPPQQPTFRSGVGVVRVDVTVTDRDGDSLADLTAGEFEVREDGVAQQVEWLQFVRVTGSPKPGDDTSLEIRSPEHAAQEAAREDVRLLVIFLDDYHLRHGPGFDVRLREMLQRFVKVEMQPTDLFAVMGPLTPISDLRLTRRKQDILDRIARFQGRLGGFVPPRSPIEEEQFGLDPVSRQGVRAQVTLSALKAVASYLGSLRDGRKSVLFVSEGPSLYAGGWNQQAELRDAITAANTSNVTIHTLDPRALGGMRWPSDANSALAGETGGRELANSNDYSRGLASVMSDSSTYYLLGYTPAREVADGKFHEIDVKVRRKGVRVLARKGYWAPNAEELRAPASVPTVPVEITKAFGALADASRPRIVTDWIGLGPVDGDQTDVTIVCAATPETSRGRPISSVRVQIVGHDGSVLSEYAGERAAPDAPWLVRFRALPGRITVRLVVQDARSTTLDRWTRETEVPATGDPAAQVGTPIVYRSASVTTHRALVSGAAMPPAVERRFRRTDRVLVRLPLAADARTAPVRAELINESGQTLVTLPVASRATGSPQVELPLTNLALAKYALRLVAVLDAGPVSRLVPFAVVP